MKDARYLCIVTKLIVDLSSIFLREMLDYLASEWSYPPASDNGEHSMLGFLPPRTARHSDKYIALMYVNILKLRLSVIENDESTLTPPEFFAYKKKIIES